MKDFYCTPPIEEIPTIRPPMGFDTIDGANASGNTADSTVTIEKTLLALVARIHNHLHLQSITAHGEYSKAMAANAIHKSHITSLQLQRAQLQQRCAALRGQLDLVNNVSGVSSDATEQLISDLESDIYRCEHAITENQRLKQRLEEERALLLCEVKRTRDAYLEVERNVVPLYVTRHTAQVIVSHPEVLEQRWQSTTACPICTTADQTQPCTYPTFHMRLCNAATIVLRSMREP